jgi:hypothetical protein
VQARGAGNKQSTNYASLIATKLAIANFNLQKNHTKFHVHWQAQLTAVRDDATSYCMLAYGI